MDSLGSDLFQIGKNQYLLVVDRYSGFSIIVEKLNSLNTEAVLKIMRKRFNDYGWPRTIRTDNCPQYRSNFKEFCKENSIIHETSSPHFSQSNGLSEAAVKQMKFLMKKVKEKTQLFAEAKLEWVNTPNESNKSPAKMFFGRKQRTKLPHLPEATKLDPSNANKGAQQCKNNLKKWSLKKKPILRELEIGQRCIVQDPIALKWDKQGKVLAIRKKGRSCLVRLTNKKTYIRNRRYIRQDKGTPKEAEEVEVQERITENQERKRKNQEEQPLRRSKRIKEQPNRGSAVMLKN